jgi:prepilin-type N-terminal cleavage/methylation domain-containing protein
VSASRRHAHGGGAERGVTLLELLAAVAILGVVAAVLYGTFSRTLAGRDAATEAMERYAVARAVVDWLERDIEGSWGAGLYPTGARRFASLGRAEAPTKGGTPLLDVTSTSSRATTPLVGPLIEIEGTRDLGDQVRVLYHLEDPADPAAGGSASLLETQRPPRDLHVESPGGAAGLDLVRYEHRPPVSAELEDASRAVVARGLQSIALRFFDGATWYEEWDSAQRASAPRLVEVRLRLADPREPLELVSAIYVELGGRRG